ncbi:hypothetical protein [Rhizobium sp.]|uniref:hypothetical protein n=1 Tax=Rhizobium sp. TaxID=391 RepID=UPI002AA95E36
MGKITRLFGIIKLAKFNIIGQRHFAAMPIGSGRHCRALIASGNDLGMNMVDRHQHTRFIEHKQRVRRESGNIVDVIWDAISRRAIVAMQDCADNPISAHSNFRPKACFLMSNRLIGDWAHFARFLAQKMG